MPTEIDTGKCSLHVFFWLYNLLQFIASSHTSSPWNNTQLLVGKELGLLSPLGVSKEELYWIVGMDHMSWGSWWESSNRSGSKIWVGKGAGHSTAMIFTAILSTLTMVSLNDHLFDIMVAHDFSFFLLKKQWFVLEFFFFFF